MSITLTVTLKNCKDCRHLTHSGTFTPEGAKPVCDHPDAAKTVKIIKNLKDDDANDPKTRLIEQCWYWENRVIPNKKVESNLRSNFRIPLTCREVKSIPNWCPLLHGSKY